MTPHFVLMAEYTAARCGLVAEGLGVAIVDPVPARALGGWPIVLRPFRPEIPIETVLVRPAGRPPGRLAERLMVHLAAERDALGVR
ncbi:DNA-binding transcriptional LysR family regulator [Methylobacterium sp. 1973]